MTHPTPDRFERMVGKEIMSEHDHMNAHGCINGTIGYNYPCDLCGNGVKQFPRTKVLKLLRRQHAAMVRQVKRMKKKEVVPGVINPLLRGYEQACDDFLAYLMKK